MSFEVLTTPEFEIQAKTLNKRHRSFKKDLKELIMTLIENPFQGVEICPDIRKVRMAITSKKSATAAAKSPAVKNHLGWIGSPVSGVSSLFPDSEVITALPFVTYA